MTPFVLTFSGSIASGKTTIARLIAEKNGFAFASFGDFVRKEARRQGMDPTSRDVLQRHGNELIEKGWQPFCQAVLADIAWTGDHGLVVDGIRHVEALETLRDLVGPLRLFLVYISIDNQTRRVRLRDRGVGEEQTIEKSDLHDTEQQVRGILEQRADLRVDGTLPPVLLAQQILNWASIEIESGA
jgi:dephospho-CoA kinase